MASGPVRMQRGLDGFAVATCVTLTLWMFLLGMDLDAWRHDSLYSLANYDRKASNEGRWLVWSASRLVTLVPGQLLWYLGYVAFALFGYALARRYALDRAAASLFALLGCQIPSVFDHSLWPGATFVATALLAVAAFAAPKLTPGLFYAVFGVLFLGVSQQYYFFLPLLHVPEIARNPSPWRATARLLGQWVAGLLLGFALSLGFVYALSGNVGLDFPAWREPNPVTDWASFVANLGSRAGFLLDHLRLWIDLPVAFMGLVATTALALRGRSPSELLVRAVVFGAVALAIYAITLPIGVRMQFRTTPPLYFALLGFAFLGSPTVLHRRFLPIGALLVFVPLLTVNVANLRWYGAVTGGYRQELLDVAPRPPASYRGLLVARGTADALQRRIEAETRLRPRYIVDELSEARGRDLRWRPSALAAGFREVRFCDTARCQRRVRNLPPRPCPIGQPAYCVIGQLDGFLVIGLPDSRATR